MTWHIDDPQGNEAAKIRWELVPYTRGRGLDLGCGPYKAFPHFIGVDGIKHPGPAGANIISNCEKLDMFASKSMDFVFSSHLLEHIEDTLAALKEWWRVIKVGGYLVLYLPHKEFYPNIGEAGANPDHKHDFLPQDIVSVMKKVGAKWDLVTNESRNKGNEYSFFQVYQKTETGGHKFSCAAPIPRKTCGIIRYGGAGDMIFLSSVLPHLKNQGFHITLYTTPYAYEIIKTDPHIDRFIIQDTDQVPNSALPAFWDYIKNKYDRFINLSESVEGTFLTLQDRAAQYWPRHVRHEFQNRNYYEFTHQLSMVPMRINPKFYPTDKETKWAKKKIKKLAGPVILWVLSGSSVHKAWPYMDSVIAWLMLNTPATVVLCGDEMSKILEQGWEKEPRVVLTSGEWTMRQSMTFAMYADLVIGPETGVMNAVSHEPVPKILFMSHSSPENLSKHWVNCSNMEPVGCACYPCHKMIYGWDNCVKDEKTGVADCQAKIDPGKVIDAITHHLKLRKAT